VLNLAIFPFVVVSPSCAAGVEHSDCIRDALYRLSHSAMKRMQASGQGGKGEGSPYGEWRWGWGWGGGIQG